MRPPSFSIAELMLIVVLVALDCMAIRIGSVLVFGGLPMQVVLVIGPMLIFRQRQPPFFIGFEAVGLICHLAYVAICFRAAESLERHLTYTLTPVLRATGFQPFGVAYSICAYAMLMIYLTVLQLTPALVAGWICHQRCKQTF